jgi:hypothetical protein
VLVLALAYVVLCLTSWPREEVLSSRGEHPRAKKNSGEHPRDEAAASRLAPFSSWKPRAGETGASVPGSSNSLASSGFAASTSPSDASLLRGACVATTLCPQLVVPENCTLQCALPRIVCQRRQNLIVSINSLAVPGGTALFQARLAEGDTADFSGAGIHLEMLGGEEEFAFLSTEDVWAAKGARQPEMEITKASSTAADGTTKVPGAKYATMRKTDSTTYIMTRGTGTLMVFSGRLSKHELQVCCATGQTVAKVSPGSTEGMYEVVVYTNTDAGLIILGLLAIDKCEVAPT